MHRTQHSTTARRPAPEPFPPTPPTEYQICPAKVMAQGLQDLARHAEQRRFPGLHIATSTPKPAA